MYITPVLLKKNKLLPQKMFMSSLCLRYGAYLNDTYNVLACLLTIFLGRDWFRLFLNK